MRLTYSPEADNASAVVLAAVQAAKGEPELTERRGGTSVAIISKAYDGEVSASAAPLCKMRLSSTPSAL